MVGIMGGPQQVPLSLSPRIHNAAFEALGLDWIYVGFPVRQGAAAEAVRGLQAAGVRGFNVTMPHKIAVADAVDRLEGTAAAIGAVNTVVAGRGELVGWNTDGEGLLRFLRRDLGVEVKGAAVLVIGSGGGARSAVASLAAVGARSITVLARHPGRAESLRVLAGEIPFRAALLGSAEPPLIAESDIIVNATPVGQTGAGDGAGPVAGSPVLHVVEGAGPPRQPAQEAAVSATMTTAPEAPPPVPIPADAIRPDATVVDMVYRPPVTPLVEAARARGAGAHGGLGMLLHQAALAFEIWTGVKAPLDVMSAAAVGELGHVAD